MPKSMTAFARITEQCDWGNASWEIRSVNHRYLETHFRMPDTLRELEMPLRELTRKHLQRGKVDISLQLQISSGNDGLDLNTALTEKVIQASEQITAKMHNPAPTSPFEVLRWPGVLQEPEVDQEKLKADLLDMFENTFAQLNQCRQR